MSGLISIIIPTYNRAEFIRETLNSILVQTYKNWECIIVDDGSVDNTADLIKEFQLKDNRIKYYHRPEKRIKGPNSCRNYGFELSKGDYIKWLDSDDILNINALETTSHYFSKHFDLIVSSLEYIDINKNIIEKDHNFFSDNIIQDYLIGKIAYYISPPTWKRSFLNNRAYLFDEEITNLDDWDFNLRMLYENPSVAYLNDKLIQYRIHHQSLSHEINKLNFKEIKSEFKAIKKHLLLIKKNKKANPRILKIYFKNRCKNILRMALVRNDKHKFYYLKELLSIEINLLRFGEMLKTIAGFTIYTVFRKGYKFL
ncbi:hypothetical protein HYN56_01670 [Flavobacterium crocinum]|uniref:Glycosyltransferase 2-like domain-containing protein n=1 Tax=Flavobacterium crocinum TaxID=2183896 RepID=A0A2S1YG27_9FLAO|nr:glycosyltransferase [Flavobacterium crocinum]AWK02991.1 hypothetical protein HYN56_01670 [Flavobacterium crocinum]